MTRNYWGISNVTIALVAALFLITIVAMAVASKPLMPDYHSMSILRATPGRCGDHYRIMEFIGTIPGDNDHIYRVYYALHLRDPKPFAIVKADKDGKMVETWVWGIYLNREDTLKRFGITVCSALNEQEI